MIISEADPDAAAAELYRQYLAAHNAWKGDHTLRHPSADCKAWRQTAHDAGTTIEAQDGMTPADYLEASATGGVAGKVAGTDDVQPSTSASGNRGNGGKVPAQDGQFQIGTDSVPRFVRRDGRVLEGDYALAAHAAQSDPARVRRMSAAIKGFDRLK